VQLRRISLDLGNAVAIGVPCHQIRIFAGFSPATTPSFAAWRISRRRLEKSVRPPIENAFARFG